MIEIIPAIDIIGGECVRLSQGEYSSKKVYDANPLEVAKRYEGIGIKRIHIVDLDGAKASSPKNLHIIEQVATKTNLKIQFGGGIKSESTLQSSFSAGVNFAICGSIAIKEPELFSKWLIQYGEKMILGADVKGVNVAINGWLESSEVSVFEIIENFIPDGLKRVICTDIACDGMLKGVNKELYTTLQSKYSGIETTVSGGIGNFSDIEELNELGLKSVIVGKAIYEGFITIKELELWLQRG